MSSARQLASATATASRTPDRPPRRCAPNGKVRPITKSQFLLFQRLIHEETGIWLAEAKKDLLVGRLGKRLRDLDIDSYATYYELVTRKSEAAERVRMIDCICTNETQFFREKRHFEALERMILPQFEQEAESGKRERRIRVWSAASSTGEEPYSLAMLLLDRYSASSRFRVEIFASDLSTRVLDKATTGVWSLQRSASIPPHLLKRFMLRGTKDSSGLMKAGKELRSAINFQRINLTARKYPLSGKFDLLFCCNVLMYFSVETRILVVNRLIDHLAPNGYLFVGHAESLFRNTDRVQPVSPTIYAHTGEGRAYRSSI